MCFTVLCAPREGSEGLLVYLRSSRACSSHKLTVVEGSFFASGQNPPSPLHLAKRCPPTPPSPWRKAVQKEPLRCRMLFSFSSSLVRCNHTSRARLSQTCPSSCTYAHAYIRTYIRKVDARRERRRRSSGRHACLLADPRRRPSGHSL